nr:MAG TPA: hypothetical protein [Caudoviricetes sp.]
MVSLKILLIGYAIIKKIATLIMGEFSKMLIL